MRVARFIAVAIALMASMVARAAPTKSFDEIRSVLAADGEWIDLDRWGSVWSPHDVFFRPYSLGHWTVDGDQWTYHGANASDELTAHYGYWFDDPLYGWVWKPDGRWRPSAVAWRLGSGVVGWAPLDPEGKTPPNAVDWVFVKGADAVAENLSDVRLPPIASTDLMKQTLPLTIPPTEMAVLGLPDPGQPSVANDRLASRDRVAL